MSTIYHLIVLGFRKNTKKAMNKVKARAFDWLYQSLGNKEGGKKHLYIS